MLLYFEKAHLFRLFIQVLVDCGYILCNEVLVGVHAVTESLRLVVCHFHLSFSFIAS